MVTKDSMPDHSARISAVVSLPSAVWTRVLAANGIGPNGRSGLIARAEVRSFHTRAVSRMAM